MTGKRLALWIGPALGLLTVSCARNDKSSVAYEPAPPPSSAATPIRSAEPGMAPPRAEAEPVAPPAQAEEPVAADPDEQIWAALERVLPEVSYINTPFEKIIETLRDQLGINIHVQWDRLEEAGVTRDRPATIHLRNVSAERLLRLVLSEVGHEEITAYGIDNGVLVISTREEIDAQMVPRVYDVRDLLRAIDNWRERDTLLKNEQSGASRAKRGAATTQPRKALTMVPVGSCVAKVGRVQRDLTADEELLEVVIAMVAPDMWMANGGLGDAQLLRGFLLVRAPERVQRQVEEFLWMLREAGVAGSE